MGIFFCNGVELTIVNTKSESTIFFFTSTTGEAHGEVLGFIIPCCSISETCLPVSEEICYGVVIIWLLFSSFEFEIFEL